MRIIVGEPETFPDVDVSFYPLIDTDTGERFGDLLFRYHNDAREAATRYNMTLKDA